MSDCYVNIRIGLYHFQLTKSWRIRVGRNEAHIGSLNGFFEIYEFKPFK